MKYCENCGLKINEETNFCSSCGKPCKKTAILPIPAEKPVQKVSDVIEQRESKKYEVVDKIKSSKWNAFLLTEEEIEEYISDGVYFLDKRFFSTFSKENRENEAVRNERFVSLIAQRVITLDEKYVKHHIEKMANNVITHVTNSIKGNRYGVFSRNLSSFLDKKIDDYDPDFRELVTKEKKESGELIKCYPVNTPNVNIKGVLLITTTGIAFISTQTESVAGIQGLAMLNTLGAVGAVAVIALGDKLHSNTITKEQQKIIDTVHKYPACLVARCINNSRFIPYDKINALVYCSKEENKPESKIYLIYDYEKRIDIKMPLEMKKDLIQKLSHGVVN